jgi:hypothetical protein
VDVEDGDPVPEPKPVGARPPPPAARVRNSPPELPFSRFDEV